MRGWKFIRVVLSFIVMAAIAVGFAYGTHIVPHNSFLEGVLGFFAVISIIGSIIAPIAITVTVD